VLAEMLAVDNKSFNVYENVNQFWIL